MNRILFFGAISLFAIACDDGKDTDTGVEGCPTDAPVIDRASLAVSCAAAAGPVTISMNTTGLPTTGTVFTQQTNDQSGNDQYADEHDFDITEDGCDASLSITLTTGEFPNVTNQSTTLTCEADTHFELAGALSHVFWVEDDTGAITDCTIVGSRLDVLNESNVGSIVDPSRLSDLLAADCDTSTIN